MLLTCACWMFPCLALGLGGCSGSMSAPDADASMPDTMLDARLDVEADTATSDAERPDTNTPDTDPPDAGTDTNLDADATLDTDTPDADIPCECPAPTTCLMHECVAGECIPTAAPRGSSCGELVMGLPEGVCLDGACAMRGCGDGYREPGPLADEVAPPRESCDDGNMLDGDACSPTCESTTLSVFAGDEDTEFRASNQVRALGVDDAGQMLFVWREERAPEEEPGTSHTMFRRFSNVGVPLDDESVELTSGRTSPTPTVVGLESGWVVVYTSRSGSTDDVVFRLLSADGAVGPERSVPSPTDEREAPLTEVPHVARLGSGFIVTWLASGPPSRIPVVRARRFSATGSALDDNDLEVSTSLERVGELGETRGRALHASAAATTPIEGSAQADFVITWTFTPDATSYPTVLARRYRVSDAGAVGAVDGSGIELPTDDTPFASRPQAVAFDTSELAEPSEIARFAVVWMGGEVVLTPESTRIRAGRVTMRELSGAPDTWPAPIRLAEEPEGAMELPSASGDSFPVLAPEPGGIGTVWVAWVDLDDHGLLIRVVSASPGAGSVPSDWPLPLSEIEALRMAWSGSARPEALGLVPSLDAGEGPGLWAVNTDDLFVYPGLSAYLLPYLGAER